MVSKWQADRSHLNHGWLQNGVLVGVRHAQGISRGAVRSRSARQSISANVLRWKERREEVPRLLMRFENEMSPRILFDYPPLCRCSEATKQWLVPVIHELWLARGHFREKIARARVAYEEVERTYGGALAKVEQLPASPSSSELNAVDGVLGALAASCDVLSQCISELPRNIRCV